MKRKFKCKDCGKKSSDVKLRIDPYKEDLYNKIEKRRICDDCYKMCQDEI